MDYYDRASISTASSRSTVVTTDEPIHRQSIWRRTKRSNISVACLVALILFTDMLVYGAVIPCLPTLILDKFHGTAKDVGILFGCFAMGYFVATPSFAIISDKYQNRRYPVLLGLSCLLVSTLSFAWASTYSILVIARVSQGVSAGASWTIGLGMLADKFPVDQLGRTMGTVIMSHTIGFILGPVIGGILYDYGGIMAPFYFCSVFCIIALLGTLWIDEPIQQKRESTESSPLLTKKKNRDGDIMFQLLKNRRISACMICCFVTAAGLSGLEPVLPIYLEAKYHVSISTVGVVFIALVAPSFLAPVTGYLSDTYGRPLFIFVGILEMSIASILVGLPVSSITYMIPSLLLFGLSNPLIHTPLMPLLGSIVSEMESNAFAQVYALYNVAYSGGILTGPLISGYVMSSLEANGFQILMLVFAVLIIVPCPIMIYCRHDLLP